MKIGIDLRLHAYAPGGISYYARRLARALSEQVASDSLTLIFHRKEEHVLDLPGVRNRLVWTPPHHPLEKWALGAEIASLNLDVLHSTDFIPPAWGARKLVTTIHDLNFLHYPDYLDAEARRYYNEQINWAVDRADLIIADSNTTRRDLTTMLDVAPERIVVAYLAADDRFRPLAPDEVVPHLASLDLVPGYLLFAGVWEPRKNLAGLLDALDMWRHAGDAPLLVIAGRPGWLYGDIYSKIRLLGLESCIRFIERPSVEELTVLYNGALALVLPSFYEGFGLPVLEAMQCGTPVVVADRASLPEVAGDAGLLIDPDSPESIFEACRRVAEDRDLRQRMRAAGLEQARQFSWAKTAAQTLAAYRVAAGD